jgi:hypothetical protein
MFGNITRAFGNSSRAGASPAPTILRRSRPIRRMVGATLAVALNLILAKALDVLCQDTFNWELRSENRWTLD